jgi:hypothetical protein
MEVYITCTKRPQSTKTTRVWSHYQTPANPAAPHYSPLLRKNKILTWDYLAFSWKEVSRRAGKLWMSEYSKMTKGIGTGNDDEICCFKSIPDFH